MSTATLILWTFLDQPLTGSALKRFKFVAARRFSTTTEKSLVTDLRRIPAPEYVTRARQLAGGTTYPAESAAAAADLMESFARYRRRTARWSKGHNPQ